jgi:uncharacterized Zn-finger protein
MQTNSLEVMCDGLEDNPALGHPRIYLHIQENKVVCPYCGKEFVYEPSSS